MIPRSENQPASISDVGPGVAIAEESNYAKRIVKSTRFVFGVTMLLNSIGVGLLYKTIVEGPVKTSPNQAETPIVIPKFPKSIPRAILKQLANVVEINTISAKGIWQASGFQIDKNEVISAGHVIDAPDNTPIKGINQCDSILVYNRWGEQLGTKAVGSYIGGDNSSVPDVSIIETNRDDSDGQYNVPVSFSKKPVHIGETLYFANYEPLPSGASRTPSLHTPPATYIGVVDGFQMNGDIDVITGLKGYKLAGDRFADSRGRPGSSGGLVVNSKGQEVGISVEMEFWGSTEHSATSVPLNVFEKSLGIYIENAHQSYGYQETTVQPITPTLLGKLQSNLDRTTWCTENP